MVRRVDTGDDSERGDEPADLDEQLGEAIEVYLALAEAGTPPDPEVFAARYPELEADLAAALEGLALVQGLVGRSGGHGPGVGLETGRRIAGYRIVRELGRGGMGVVYEAVHVGLDRPVALKVLGGHAAPDPNGRRRFLNEARTAAGLHHTHIVPVFDVGQVGGLCYYAMQRIEGSGLDVVVRHLRRDRGTGAGSTPGANTPRLSRFGLRLSSGPRGSTPTVRDTPRGSGSETGLWTAGAGAGAGAASAAAHGPDVWAALGAPGAIDDDTPPPFDPPRGSGYYRWVAEVGRQAAEALGHAHRRGVIHRDVKPSNLLVDGRGLVWVADFGLARRLADPGLTQHDSLLGTPRYMSPEQTRVGPVDGRSDLYSLGATLYELLTLRPPFEGRSAAELVEQIAGREPPPPRQSDPRVPRDLETIVLKLLSKRPADRYPAAAALAEDLTRFLNFEPVQARRISLGGRLWRFARRHPSVTAVSTAAAVTVLAVSTVAYIRVARARDAAVTALRKQLWREASVVRLSSMPNRRATGLGLIREAAALKPEPALRGTLRNEAVEFLVLRDVEARPSLPTGHTRGLAFGPDGTRLAAVSTADDTSEALSVWDVAARVRLSQGPPRPVPQRGPGGPRSDGPVVAAAGPNAAVIAPDARGVRLIDIATGEKVRDLTMPGRRVTGVYASPDGRRLVTVETLPPSRPPAGAAAVGKAGPRPGPPGRFLTSLWDPEQLDVPLATLAQTEPEPGGRNGTPLVAVSPDGKTVAVARTGKTSVSLWLTETGRPAGQIDTQTDLSALALGPDNQLATAGSGEVRLWDAVSLAPLPSLTPNQSFVRFLRFSPKGSLLAIVGFGARSVELWDTAAHAPVAALPTPDPVSDVAFSPDGRTLAAAGRGATASVWAVIEPDARVRLSGFDATTLSMAFRPDGLLAMGAFNGRIRFWSEGRCLNGGGPHAAAGGDLSGDPPPREGPASLAFDARGRLLTLESGALRVCDDPPGCDAGARVPLPATGGRPSLPVLAPSSDGRTVAVGRSVQAGRERRPQVLLWHSEAPETLAEIALPRPRNNPPPSSPQPPGRGRGRGRTDLPPSLAVGPGGRRLYLVEGGGSARAWALDGPEARLLVWPDLPGDATGLALSPNGGVLAVGDHAGAITLIDTATGKAHARLSPPAGDGPGLVLSLAFSPDGRLLAVGTLSGQVDLWSLADTSAPLVRLPGHRGFVAALAFDARGRHLASAGSDRTVDVWDLDRVREEFARLGLAW